MADQNINIKLLIDAADAAKSVQETKKALRDLKTAALQVEEGSQAFIDISTAAGQLQDKIGDLAATTKFLGDDLKNLKGFTSIASGIAGSFAAAQGAAALFGGENKQLEASLLKVQSAMGILQGIQAVGEVLQKESAASLFITNGLRKVAITLAGEQAIATAATAVANGTATITQRALNAAMNANPILALVGLLVTATAALYAFSKSSDADAEAQEKARKEAEARTKAIKEQEKAYTDFIGKEESGYLLLTEQLKQTNPQSQERLDLITKINETYGTTLKNLSDETLFQNQVNKSVEDYISFLKVKFALQANEKLIQDNLSKQRKLEMDLAKEEASLNESIEARKRAGYKDTGRDLRIALELQYEIVDGLKSELASADTRLQSYVKNALDSQSKISESGLKLANETVATTTKTSKKVVDTAKQTADKLAELNLEYQQALAELVVETNDALLEQEAILLSLNGDSEANAIAQQNLETQTQINEQKNKQVELEKLITSQQLIQLELAKLKKGKDLTEEEKKQIVDSEAKIDQYQKAYEVSQNTIVLLTQVGEKSVYSIQKDYAGKRKKLLEESTKQLLTTGEYDRFIKVLNMSQKMKVQQEDLGVFLATRKDFKVTLTQLKAEEDILKSKERNIEYQKEINKGLLEQGMITQQDLDRVISDVESANAKSLVTITELRKKIQELKGDMRGPQIVTTSQDDPNAAIKLQEAYLKYKVEAEGLSDKEILEAKEKSVKLLFELDRQSNLDQLGANEKSIDILSALYGEKFNIIKNGEDEINKILATSGKVFSVNPKEGQIGLAEAYKLDNAEVTALLAKLNKDLKDTYQENIDNEQAYFEESTFNNFTTLQEKLAANQRYYNKGEISEREFNKNKFIIEKEYTDKDKTLKENHEENLLAIGVVYGEKTQEDIVDFGKARLAEKQSQADQEKAIEDKKNAYLIQAGQSLFNTLRSFQDDMLENTLNRIEQEQELRLAAIDAELLDFDNRDKEITAAEQAKIDERKAIEDKKALVKAEYDKKVRAEKIRQFNIQKAMDIIQIGINTAVAVSASLAPPLLPMVPFIVAAGAAEAFFVAAQQPNFADGGLVIGPGGPKDDMINANLSNGEVVINAKSSKKYAQVLDAINQAGGGKPIPYKDGGLVTNPMSTSNNVDMDDFKSLILDIVNRPIETYVKESSITNAQKSQSKQNRRTSF
jgi:hypothetical protein